MKPESVQAQLDRPLAGRLIGWGALLAALIAAVMFASSLVELRSAQPLSAGASPADEAPAAAAAVPEAAPVALVDDMAIGGTCATPVTDSADFEVGENRTLSVPGYTGSGELTSVTVSSSVSFRSAGTVTNVGGVAFTFESFPSRTFVADLSGPDIDGVTIDRSSPLFTSVDVATDEVKDISIGTEAATNSETLTSVASYAAASVEFPVTSTGDIALVLGPNADASIRSFVVASVSVTYCFTPVPSPEITVSKTVEPAGAPGVGSFAFSINCGGATLNFTLNAGEAVVLPLEGVADDANCTVTETITESGRWAPAVNGVCGNVVVVPATGRADFVNRLADPYGPCPTK